MDQKELKPPGGGGPTPLAQEWRKKYSIDNVRPGVEAVSPYFACFFRAVSFRSRWVIGSAVPARWSKRTRIAYTITETDLNVLRCLQFCRALKTEKGYSRLGFIGCALPL